MHFYRTHSRVLRQLNKKVKAISPSSTAQRTVESVSLPHLFASRLPVRVLFVTARRTTTLWLELKVRRDDRPY